RVYADQMDFGPIGIDGIFQRSDRMAGNPLCANPFFLFRLVESVHDAFPIIRPAGLGHAMNQHAVDVIRIVSQPVTIDGSENVVRLIRDFRLNEQVLARQTFDGIANPGESFVAFGRIDVSDAAIVSMTDQFYECFFAGANLVMARIDAGANAKAAEFDAGLAERDLVDGRAFGFGSKGVGGAPLREQGGTGNSNGGVSDKLAAIEEFTVHRNPFGTNVQKALRHLTRRVSLVINMRLFREQAMQKSAGRIRGAHPDTA